MITKPFVLAKEKTLIAIEIVRDHGSQRRGPVRAGGAEALAACVAEGRTGAARVIDADQREANRVGLGADMVALGTRGEAEIA